MRITITVQSQEPDQNQLAGTSSRPADVSEHIKRLKDENSSQRLRAASALAEIGDAQAVEALYVALCNDTCPSVHYSVTRALVKIGEGSVLLLCVALKNQEHCVRYTAANALGEIGDIQAVEPLCVALKDVYVYVRHAAASALVQIGEGSILALCAALKDKDYSIRHTAASALANFGDATTLPLRILSTSIFTTEQRLNALETLSGVWSRRPGTYLPYKIGNVQKFCEDLCRQVDIEESIKCGAEAVLAEWRQRADATELLRTKTHNEPREAEELLRAASGSSGKAPPEELLRSADAPVEQTSTEKTGMLSRIFRRK